ncbi:hypothetical protein Ddye_014011 [Dipteronia dyeriana]|uniref:CCHC-type domain-containing protein n=1 Tax=Dipteronia dyeriana TaxID=168575 RepID=A0AAD9X7D0_9ROSI|nr:hypothetical protein Ddye_014011 [Dipteronia dyeriana]
MKKGSDSIDEFALRIKNLGDSLMSAGEDVRDTDLVPSLINGVGHDFDAIVVVVISTQQRFISFEDAHTMHEQRLKHLNSSNSDVIQAAANFASDQNSRGQHNGVYQNNRGGHRGRGRNYISAGRIGNRIHCQVCNKPGHGALKCYNRFD